jgi:hypothetical protein
MFRKFRRATATVDAAPMEAADDGLNRALVA